MFWGAEDDDGGMPVGIIGPRPICLTIIFE